MSETEKKAGAGAATKKDDRVPRSAMRGLFLGRVAEEFYYPFPRLEADERENLELALDAFRQWADENLDSEVIDREQEIPEPVRQGLHELGIMGFTVPEEYGGYGFSMTSYCRLTEEICRRDGAVATYVGGHLSIGSKVIQLFATEEQKKHWLPKVASGEVITAFALTEPQAGSDASNIRTRAVWNEEKQRWILNGNKIWITNGSLASLVTVFAQTAVGDGEASRDRITAFLVEASSPGYSAGSSEHKMGIRGSSTSELAFQDVEVPDENVIGGVGRGIKTAFEILNTGRLSLAAGCIGAAKEMLDLSLRHAMEREQFSTRVIDFEQVRRKFSSMASEIYAMEAVTYLTAGLADRSAEDLSMESAACKVFCSEAGWRTVNHAVQAVGGIGYMTEYPYERYLRDMRINQIFEGTNEVLRMLVALSGLRKPGSLLKRLSGALKRPLGEPGEIARYATRRIRRAVSPDRPEWVADALDDEAEELGRAASALAGAAEAVLRKHGKEVTRRGYLHRRFADAAIELYAVGACLSRASTRLASEGEEAAERDILLARVFSRDALRRARSCLERIEKADDTVHDEVAELLKERQRYPTPLI